MISDIEIEVLRLSLKIAGWAVLCSLPFAVGISFLLSRRRFPGRFLLDGIVHLPLVIPPVAVGYILLLVLGRQGVVGGWLYDVFGVTLVFSWQGAAVAAAVMAFPLMVRAIRLSLDSVDQKIEAAAQTLGASPLRVFLTITLPLIAPGILTGTVLAFARALGEFGATITFVSNIAGETRTLPIALYTLLQAPGSEDAALRIVGISIALALLALLASELLARRVARRLSGEPS
ncbi:MAG: molybdate ABC transporter permease subunit [Alphaproteobacteria bacterium]|jgi:molybdate transport system permease protein|nr:molybdate ABC transporter permease subunit [Alphaproteobacteria bacterium]MBT4085237.1 molybdate ABC transporter permease subunit [Alphaproteobacteria bacterium]MBT4544953.1 molybdate ABC transporter permease subunit [Alphaproteobacteria bacterium]MBT7746170.1 molybdate ABC transporter permease subunit [Alphaproteobacteria bacterium]